jgi:hypothetical protein
MATPIGELKRAVRTALETYARFPHRSGIARGDKVSRKQLKQRLNSFVETTVQKVYGEG